jgi:hypothetical protein
VLSGYSARAKLSSQHPLSQQCDPSLRPDLVPLAQFPSPSETAVVISLLESAGIRVFHHQRHYHISNNPQLYVTREAFDEANRVLERARWHSHLVPEPASPRDERSSLMTAILWIVTAAMLISLIHDFYKLLQRYLR